MLSIKNKVLDDIKTVENIDIHFIKAIPCFDRCNISILICSSLSDETFDNLKKALWNSYTLPLLLDSFENLSYKNVNEYGERLFWESQNEKRNISFIMKTPDDNICLSELKKDKFGYVENSLNILFPNVAINLVQMCDMVCILTEKQ